MQTLNKLKKSSDKLFVTEQGQKLLESFETFQKATWVKGFDRMLPWFVREFKEGRISVEQGVICRVGNTKTHRLPVWRYVKWFESKHSSRQGCNIMAKENSLQTVFKKVKEFEKSEKAKQKAQEQKAAMQGETVYTFEDGWTIQRLHNPKQLDWESEQANHCIGHGSYDNLVTSQAILVFSLRDQKGIPHITFDVSPKQCIHKETKQIKLLDFKSNLPQTDKDWNIVFYGSVLNNCYGHSDSVPKKEYAERIKLWMNSLDRHQKIVSNQTNADSKINSFLQIQQLLQKNQLGDKIDSYGFIKKQPVAYLSMLKRINKKDNPKEAWNTLLDFARQRGETEGLKRVVWETACSWRYGLAPEPDTPWKQTEYWQILQWICQDLQMSVPKEHHMISKITKQAMRQKRKTENAKAWRAWYREQKHQK